jgi:hypothetical protein
VKVETDFDVYRDEINRANAFITAPPPDSAPAWWPPELFGEFRLHVVTETACHAGHLDAVREFIGGRRWLVLTE